MTPETPADLIRQELELIDQGVAMQTQGLQLLLAEMHALAAMLPVAPAIEEKTEEEVEEGFDNLPI